MTLFFMHITKTAGGSLKEMLRDSKADVRFHYAEEEGFRKWFWYRPAPEIIFGHFVYGVHRNAQLAPRYAAFFRKPAERSISHYWHLYNVDTGPAGQNARQFASFADYVRNAGRREFDNFQCRTVAGIGDRKQFGKVNEHDLEIALENLRTFEFIGIFEDLERSVERLNRLVPSLQASMPVVNKGSYDKAISDDDLAAAREINRYDEILYQEALKLASEPASFPNGSGATESVSGR